MTTTGCTKHRSSADDDCDGCRYIKRLLEEKTQRLLEELLEERKETQRLSQALRLFEEQRKKIQRLQITPTKGLVIRSVSVAAKDKVPRSEFRKKLPEDPYPGAFVAHDFYIAFVKAARRMTKNEDSTTQWPSDSEWNDAKRALEGIGQKIKRREHSLFPENSNIADLEEPQSAVATELLGKAIDFFQKDEGDNPIFVTHQFSVVDWVNDAENEILGMEKSEKKTPTKIEFKVDILVWVTHEAMGCTAIAATEYKPDDKEEARRKAQADMYGVNIMSMHHKPCIVVDIEGRKDWTAWNVCASAIIPIPLSDSGTAAKQEQRYSKSTLFTGTGVVGIVGLAAGLVSAVCAIPEAEGDFGTLLGPVVGYSKKTGKVTKAYDQASYRCHNIDIVRKLVDPEASIFVSEDEALILVETEHFASTWTEPVPLSVFADLLEQLCQLHEEHGPHGDIRLANMLRKKKDGKGCLIDFDFVPKRTDEKEPTYPGGLKDLTVDGKRHDEVVRAIQEGTEETLVIEKYHDYYSMSAVMDLFESDALSSTWDKSKELTKKGDLETAALELRAKVDATVVLSEHIILNNGLPGTGGTPKNRKSGKQGQQVQSGSIEEE